MILQSLHLIQDEVRQLLESGEIVRHQPIYVLSRYFTWREWMAVERELEANCFLLRDRISDLVPTETWGSD